MQRSLLIKDGVDMKTLLKILPIACLLSGCAALPALPGLSSLLPSARGTQMLTSTSVDLAGQNFKLIRANASGHSTGFSLFGLFNFKSPQFEEAITHLYQSANVSTGKAQTLVNIMYDQTSTYFLLFSLPKITVRADVIEFTGPPPAPGTPYK
jgi:hypothetical protein